MLVKALFFAVRTGPWDSLVHHCAAYFAFGVSSQPSCEVGHLCNELGVCGDQRFVVDFYCHNGGRKLLQHNFLCGCGRIKIFEVIFEVVFVDDVVKCSALWGSCLA